MAKQKWQIPLSICRFFYAFLIVIEYKSVAKTLFIIQNTDLRITKIVVMFNVRCDNNEPVFI